MPTTFTHNITVSLPRSLKRSTVIAALQDHSAMISLNPLTLSHSLREAPPSSDPWTASYDIKDSISYIPGMWQSTVAYAAHFRNVSDGVDTESHAPMGFLSVATWRVMGGYGGTGAVVLEERAEVTCPTVLRPFVEKTIRRSHEKMCDDLVKKMVGDGITK